MARNWSQLVSIGWERNIRSIFAMFLISCWNSMKRIGPVVLSSIESCYSTQNISNMSLKTRLISKLLTTIQAHSRYRVDRWRTELALPRTRQVLEIQQATIWTQISKTIRTIIAQIKTRLLVKDQDHQIIWMLHSFQVDREARVNWTIRNQTTSTTSSHLNSTEVMSNTKVHHQWRTATSLKARISVYLRI